MAALLWANQHRLIVLLSTILVLIVFGAVIGLGHALLDGHHEHFHQIGADDGEH